MNNKKRILFVVLIVLLFAESIPFGNICAKAYVKNGLFQIYKKEIVLANEVIIDDQQTVDKYGGSLVLPSGISGYISDKIDYWGDERGYDFIDASLTLNDGNIIDIAIALNAGSICPSVPTIDITNVEDYNTIKEEYKLSRETYFSSINKANICGLVLGALIPLILSISVWLIDRLVSKTGKNTTIIYVVFGLIILIVMMALFYNLLFVI